MLQKINYLGVNISKKSSIKIQNTTSGNKGGHKKMKTWTQLMDWKDQPHKIPIVTKALYSLNTHDIFIQMNQTHMEFI